MSVCDGSDNEDPEMKPEPMAREKVKSEESPPESESDDPHSYSQHVLAAAQLQTVTDSGKLYVIE